MTPVFPSLSAAAGIDEVRRTVKQEATDITFLNMDIPTMNSSPLFGIVSLGVVGVQRMALLF
jgi:hypothetical protein